MADSQSNTSELKSGIYAIRCLVNGKAYVGSAVNIVSRWRVHKHHLTQHKHHSIHLQRAWDKHGSDAFIWEVLEHVEPAKLIEREQHHIDTLNASNCRYGFNRHPIAGSSLGVKHSDATRAKMSIAKQQMSTESKAKMSASQRKRCSTPEHRARMSELLRGRSLPAETRAKMSESRRGRIVSPETRAKIAESHRGMKASPESRAKMSKSQLGNQSARGTILSEEARAKMSESRKGRIPSPETRAKRSKSLLGNQNARKHDHANQKRASSGQSLFRWPED